MNIFQSDNLLISCIFALTNIIPKSVFFSTLILWLLPLFRQANDKFFYYFCILAISEPITLILYYFWKVPIYGVFLPASFLLMLSIIGWNATWEKILWTVNTLLLIIVILLFQNLIFHLTAFYHIILLGYFIALFLKKYFTRDIINLYILMLVVYEFATTIMFSLKFVRTRMNIAFSSILSLFEILICIFFIFYSYKNSPKIHLLSQKKHTSV